MRSLIVFLLLLPTFAYSQINESTIFNAYTTDKGLPSNGINCIIQDKLGYIWFGTENGLTKFDGYEFYTYYSNESDSTSLPHNRIFDLEIDENGTIWAGTSYGLVRFNRYSNNFTIFNTQIYSLPDNNIQQIEIDDEQNVWFSASSAVCKLNQESLTIEVFPVQAIVNPNINEMLFHDNKLWLSVNDELVNFNTKNQEYTKVPSFTTSNSYGSTEIIQSMDVDTENNIWVATNFGRIMRINSQSLKNNFQYKNPQSINTVIEEIFVDSQSNIYFLIDKIGLSTYNKAANTIERINNSYFTLTDHRNMLCLFEDNQNNYWIGHQKYGISHTRKASNFELINSQAPVGKAFSSNVISALHFDKNETLWVGTDGGGTYSKEKGEKAFSKENSLNSVIVLSINPDNNNNIWFGTFQNGVNKYSLKNKKFTNFSKTSSANSLASNDIRKVIVDNKGIYWFVTHGQGLTSYQVETNTYTNYTTKDGLSGNWIFDIVCDTDNTIWVATSHGLCSILDDRKTIKKNTHIPNVSNSLINNHVFSLHIDKKNNLWCGTQEGLSKLVDKEFSNFLYSKEVSINSILEDDSGFLWLGTTDGIKKINSAGELIDNYNSFNDLGGNYYNINACTKDKYGFLYFGGTHGIVKFHPDSLSKNTRPPLLSLEDIIINDNSMHDSNLRNKILMKSIYSYNILGLSHTDNNIQFKFTAINFINASENKYAYRLIGLDSTWIEGKFPLQITYNTLPPGKYTLEVKAANNSGVWTNQPIYIGFTISPPFWETWLFRILLILCIAAIVIIYMYYKTKAVRKQNIKLEQKVKKRTHELSIALDDIKTERDTVESQNQELINIADKLQEQNLELDKINKTKNRLFSIIAHDIKNPFLSLMGIGKFFHRDFDKINDSQKKENIQNINSTAETIFNHLSNMLDWARGKSDSLKCFPNNISVKSSIEEVIQLLQTTANSKQILLSSSIVEDIAVYADKNMFMAMLRNIISNALKFTPNQGSVTIEAKANKKHITIIVTDSGVGISKENINKILNPNEVFSSYGTNNEPGTGLGIQICQQFANINKGTLDIKSEEGSGSVFTISLPAGSKKDMVTTPIENEIEDLTITEEAINLPSMKHKHILIVEDNSVIQEHLKSELSIYFSVETADNGSLAWNIIDKKQPDIVLSDVAMPEMDGYELCSKIKQDIQTSHIPVILVTAQRHDEDRHSGLESGANDYILKPYKISELVYKIKNIFDTTEHIKKRFKLDEKDYSEYTSIDDKFLKTLTKILDENYSNSELNVVELGKEIGMSRANLYKKCMSLTGKNPQDLLQETRIIQAIELLKNTDLSVSDIAYKVGYNDPRYFSTRFKSYTNKTPREFRN